MYICLTALILNDNNIDSGGLLYTLSYERVGHCTPAQKTAYQRQYHQDGSYTYTQIEANILCQQGEFSFHGLGRK